MTEKVNISTDLGADVNSVSHALAARIKDFRKQQKFTLDELSRRAGVSKGMLVEIEKGTANPSIAILCKISAAMGVSVADIVDVAGKPAAHLVGEADIPVLWRGEQGGTARLLAGTSGPDMVELWRWEMAPGERFSSAGHPAGTCELFHTDEGVLSLQVDGSVLTVPKGCSAVARTDVPHHYANEGTGWLIFTMTVAERH
ncbi:XRE family transcriptional regulator [Erwinia persicina]|uniref:helix-turn-helix domain-containing protein n=1 Tax=Erwinia persicina TaxID=55211 RepID=UPI000E4D8172|nr:helix-turn-helix domain-containing protein [Erwinia persicina]AXU94388.1 XRE family transcriptional regulator [Erwinia persicina]MCQ4093364.1 helix-turn-helix domain-containing protein [Erwinia persicina]MCQ4099132.1 helix-turn-helix domain-containing protein [Erwinia persicina]